MPVLAGCSNLAGNMAGLAHANHDNTAGAVQYQLAGVNKAVVNTRRQVGNGGLFQLDGALCRFDKAAGRIWLIVLMQV